MNPLTSYPIPRRYLFAGEWEMNFWDVVWYLAAAGQGVFQTTTPQVTRLMSGLARYDKSACRVARGYFVRLRRRAVEQGELLDLTPADALAEEWGQENPTPHYTHRVGREAFYRLALPDYPNGARQDYALKPAGYVAHGWLRAVQPAIPKRVLNFFFLAAPGHTLRHSREHWLERIQAWSEEECGATLRKDKVEEALDLLLGLRALGAFDDGIALDRSVFAHTPEQAHELASLTASLSAQDPERAALAGQLVTQGGLALSDLARVYAALAEFDGPTERDLLREAVLAQQGSPATGRWARALKAAREKRDAPARRRQNPQKLRSSRAKITFDLGLPQRRTLQFDASVDQAVVVSARLVLRAYVADWKVWGGPVERLALNLTLFDSRGQAVPGADLTLTVRSDWETASRSVDLSAAVQGLPDLREFELLVKAERAVRWVKLHACMELGVWLRSGV